MIKYLQDRFSLAFFIIFSAVFTLVTATVIFGNDVYRYTLWKLLLVIFLFVTVAVLFYRAVCCLEQTVVKYYYIILGLFLLFMISMQIYSSFLLRFDPLFDLEAIYKGAIEWSRTGTFRNYSSSTCDSYYFYRFPNNLGGLALLTLVLKAASLFGVNDTFLVASVFNSLLSAGTMALAAGISKRLFGAVCGVMTLFFFGCSLPFYFIAPVFYTDALSMIFPVLILYIYLKSQNYQTWHQLALCGMLMGLAAGIGMLIKFTVVIAVIASMIYMLLHRHWKQTLSFAAGAALAIGLILTSFDTYIYSAQLDKSIARQMNLPYTHWIMMALNERGAFSLNDLKLTMSIQDPDERRIKTEEKIRERIDKLGTSGILKLVQTKSVRSFGDGTYALSDFLDDRPKNSTTLHKALLYNGARYQTYQHICGGIFFGILAFMAISGLKNVFSRQRSAYCFIPQLSVFGIWLFLMMWETTGRYMINYIPMMIISASSGMQTFYAAVKKAKKAISYRPPSGIAKTINSEEVPHLV